MGSRNEDLSAGEARSPPSRGHTALSLVDHFGGYSWHESGKWLYGGAYPGSRHDPIPDNRQPVKGESTFSDDYGNYFTRDERGRVYPSDEFGRYRSNSPPTHSSPSQTQPTHQPESSGEPISNKLPNQRVLRPDSWTPDEDELLVSLVREAKLNFAQMSEQFLRRSAGACQTHWNQIKTAHQDVSYRPEVVRQFQSGANGGRRRSGRKGQ